MQSQVAQHYLRTRVLTATPEQLQLMLYDGAIQFLEQGKAALLKKDFEASCRVFTKAQNILNELISATRPDVYPALCGKLVALYHYAYRHVLRANVHHELAAVEEALKVLRFQRETWTLLIQQLGNTKAAAQPAPNSPPDPGGRASLCLEG
jgi:flagellar secretion chaperone FliS